ncbi:MAG: M42 family metallopeptidase [Salibacteraceae bacterium]
MPIDVALLKEICETAGAPGFEQRMRALVWREVIDLVDEVSTDNLGNITAFRKGKSDKKVMVAAHIDEIGFIITHIDEEGFLRFHTLGGFDPKTLVAQRVVVHGRKDLIGVMGSKPIHVMTTEERGRMPKTTDFFIDLGLPKTEVEKLVRVGDPVTRERELIEMGDCVNCKSIDNRVSVFVLIQALKDLKGKPLPFDLHAVFTVQEEVGVRGASVASLAIQPDFGICIDTTIAYDVPGSRPQEQITRLGKGTAVKIMDATAICDYRMVTFLRETADKNNITWQSEILTAGGTDSSGIQRMSAGGAISGAISIPTRNIHQVIEMAHKSDIQGAIDLLVHGLLNLGQFDWSHREL